jgi:hypothetical protein
MRSRMRSTTTIKTYRRGRAWRMSGRVATAVTVVRSRRERRKTWRIRMLYSD